MCLTLGEATASCSDNMAGDAYKASLEIIGQTLAANVLSVWLFKMQSWKRKRHLFNAGCLYEKAYSYNMKK